MKEQAIFRLFIVLSMFIIIGGSALVADENTSNLQSVVLEDFELVDGKPKRIWQAVPDRFGKEGSLDSGKSLQELAWINAWPEAYFGKEGVFDDGNQKKDYKTSLGVKVAFTRQGYNSVELYPCVQKDGSYIKTPVPFKGRVHQVDLWIWGSNYNYQMELVLMDYRGVEHRLPIGNIMHTGWKNFVVTIPSYVPQSVAHIPRLKTLSLVKIVVWTNPKEKVNGAFIYIDHIKYLADIFESKYDGYNLGDPDQANELWKQSPKAPEDSKVTP